MSIFHDHFGYRRHANALRYEQMMAYIEYAARTNCPGKIMLAHACAIGIWMRSARQKRVVASRFKPQRVFRPGGVSARPAN